MKNNKRQDKSAFENLDPGEMARAIVSFLF